MADRRPPCPTLCPCICHDTNGAWHAHEGEPCPGKTHGVDWPEDVKTRYLLV